MEQLKNEAIDLLIKLIKTPSLSGEEDGTAEIITNYLKGKGIPFGTIKNNIIIKNKYFETEKKTILLNSHHDTVKPNASWVSDPFGAMITGEKIVGLGSNDAGGSLVSLLATFLHFYKNEMDHNLVLIMSAEEENFGPNGIKRVINEIDFPIELAIVGEPTEMKMAIAEKGLLVLDGLAKGASGHAARPNGQNAIDIALRDVQKINNYQFTETSDIIGPVVKSVTQIKAGYQHNIIPDECHFVVDVRVNEHYKLEDIFEILQDQCTSTLTARSFNNAPSGIAEDHWIVKAGKMLGIETFGSVTLSDQVNLPCNSIKIGPGDSNRSHQAEEYILISEIEEGIDVYINLLKQVVI
jgi:acetylornithine deacetylase